MKIRSYIMFWRTKDNRMNIGLYDSLEECKKHKGYYFKQNKRWKKEIYKEDSFVVYKLDQEIKIE